MRRVLCNLLRNGCIKINYLHQDEKLLYVKQASPLLRTGGQNDKSYTSRCTIHQQARGLGNRLSSQRPKANTTCTSLLALKGNSPTESCRLAMPEMARGTDPPGLH